MTRPHWISAVLILALTGSAPAAHYYVSPAGSDAHRGTLSHPWRTIRHGISRIKSGDTLFVRGGLYTNDHSLTSIPSGFSWSALTTIRNYPGEMPVIRPLTTADVGGFNLQSGRFICIEGLEIDLTNTTCTSAGVKISENANHIRVTNCVIHHIYSAHGIILSEGALNNIGDNEILGNEIYRAGWRHVGGREDHGIYCKTPRNKIMGNHVHGNAFLGIQLYDGLPQENHIAFNRVHSNAGEGIGIYAADTNWVYGNLCYSNVGSGITVGYRANHTFVFNNTCWKNGLNYQLSSNAGTNTVFENCIAAEGTSQVDGGGFYFYDSRLGVTVRNCLSYGNALTDFRDPLGQAVLSSNLFGSAFAPLFVNPPASFALQPGSAAIDAGSVLAPPFALDFIGTPRPQGPAWDIGAYEFPVVPPP